MRSILFALVLTACASPPPPVAPSQPPPAPPPTSAIATLPSMVPPGQSALLGLEPDAPPAAPAAAAPGQPRQGAMERSMANCPTAVAGAATRAVNTESGIDLTITADDPASQRRIFELADLHARIGEPDGSAPAHTGLHGGPGGIGHCPVIHDATTVMVSRLRRGVVIHVRALVPGDAPRVQTIVNDRLAAVAAR